MDGPPVVWSPTQPGLASADARRRVIRWHAYAGVRPPPEMWYLPVHVHSRPLRSTPLRVLGDGPPGCHVVVTAAAVGPWEVTASRCRERVVHPAVPLPDPGLAVTERVARSVRGEHGKLPRPRHRLTLGVRILGTIRTSPSSSRISKLRAIMFRGGRTSRRGLIATGAGAATRRARPAGRPRTACRTAGAGLVPRSRGRRRPWRHRRRLRTAPGRAGRA